MAPPKFPCSVCKSNVTNNQEGLKCCICDRWNHKKCGILDDVYQLASRMEQTQGYHIWSCEGCGIGLIKLHNVMSSQAKEIEHLKKGYEEVKETAESNKNDLSEVKETIDNVVNEIKQIKKSQPAIVESSIYQEINERNSKKKNLVIHSIAESDSSAVKDRKEDDINQLKDLFTTMKLTISEDDISFTARLGTKVDDNNRPLLVGFKDQSTRDSIFNNVRKLSKSKHSYVSIVPDLTAKQREEDQRLRTEVENNNKELTEDDLSKNLEWRLVGVTGERRLIKGKKRDRTMHAPRNSRMEIGARDRIPSQRRQRDLLTDSEEEENRPTSKKQC